MDPHDSEETELIEAFFDELKNNKSIRDIFFWPINLVQMFDLSYFLQNNANIKDLRFGSRFEVTPEQCNILSNALPSAQLRKLDLYHCRFGNDGLFEQIVSACLGVETLEVSCSTNSQVTAVAALLRDPRAVLGTLMLQRGTGLDQMLASREIAASLVSNTKLKKLIVNLDVEEGGCFDMLLCNSSDLDSICSSNHTLEIITLADSLKGIPMRVKECLKLNKNSNKNQVIRHKIMQYYFIGSFDMAPFASMPLSVLSEIMGLGGEMNNMHPAIFELLRGIPDLCNVSSRSMQFQHSFKRQKVHK
jgi:hypothetical protein